MASFRCSLCERELRQHCPVPATDKDPGRETCGWWTCSNQACTASTYDVNRGVLVYRDGHREQLGA